jgi:hypothetical protein
MPTTTTTGAARANAPIRLPGDVAGLLATFDLTLPGLLTTSNPKLAKTERAGIARSVIHHALPSRGLARAINPATVATTAPRGYVPALRALAERTGMVGAALRHNGCMHATAGCIAGCLAGAGHGGLSVSVTAARGRRTLAMVADPITYARAMVYAIAAETARAIRDGLPLAVRLNGTDEAPWFARTFPVTDADAVAIRRRFGVDVATGDRLNIAETFEPMGDRVRLYEYLKAGVDAPDGLRAWMAAGWSDVTASFAADRATACSDAVAALIAGFRVALPVALRRSDPLPGRVLITPTGGKTAAVSVVDGDATDARFDDPAGVAVVLREKRARGADRESKDRFILPNAPLVRLADGVVQFLPA